MSTNPEAVKQCSLSEFGEHEAAPGTGLYLAPACKTTPESENTIIGVNRVIVALYNEGGTFLEDVPLEGKVYNLEQPAGRASDFGVALPIPEEITKSPTQLYAHTMIEGGVEWGQESNGTGQGNYHDYYEINVSTTLPLISSVLVLKGNIGNTGRGGFITNPSSCQGPGPATTNTVKLTSTGNAVAPRAYETPIGTEGCNGASPFSPVPFAPEFALTPETKQSDSPDGITTELKIPHDPSPAGIDTSQVKTTIATLPPGMTMNPSAAAEVTESCTPAQARINSSTFGVGCPGKSKIGTDVIQVPTLPEGSLTGNMYLGGPEGGGPITGPPYTVYLNAESTRYGVDVRVKGTVTPNEETGQLTAKFETLPEQPFSNAILKFSGGALAPIANPLACGTATSTTSIEPYIGSFATKGPSSSFAVDSNNAGGACASPLPFSLSQSTVNQAPGNGGAPTSYTVSIDRGEGQQYISQVKTVLPAGLVGLLPSVTKCGEPQASKGECPSASQIGVVGVTAGAGPTPYAFSGPVYLTGPYGGAPFGLSIVVPAVAGPFNLGNVVTRGTLDVEPYTARVVATSNVPTIVKGIPLRLRHIAVNINKQSFLQNPTNCGKLSTDTTLSGFTTLGVAGSATQTISTPFQVSNCNKLAYKPKFGAATGAKTSKANGASIETTLNIPAGDANTKSVLVQLPKQLPSRLTTLQKACPEKTFASDPYHCPSGSFVGGVRANTPTLATKLKGPAILVSHGGEAFPDLDLLLEGEGVRVILVGNTKITKGITTTNFANTPDDPVSSITVNLPIGPHSALAANGDLCKSKLVMPTTIVAQNGVKVKQNTTVKVTNCPVQVVGKQTVGNVAYLTVRTFSPGRISGKGSGLANTFRKLKQAQKAASLKVPLTGAGRSRGRPFKVKVRVG
ncbi:MAG TPA: hypothetical protein VL972_04905, partial [Solirubrobacteraceae bacterium]|nr:hypothetical protein [Solirubrobacteraceae bacterium]